MNKQKTALIFLNGDPIGLPRVQKYLEKDALLIGCDGGSRHILHLGYQPDVVIGDFDSLMDSDKAMLHKDTAHVSHPADKDYTDGEAAIRYALEHGCDEIILCSALGGRLDHLIGNVLLLYRREFRKATLKIIDDTQEAYVIRGHSVIHGKKGDTISFIPLTSSPQIIRSSGLRYDLSRYRLSRQGNTGISNVMLRGTAEVVIASGSLLVIHQISS